MGSGSRRPAAVRTLSPLAGLSRRSLGEREVTAQSLGTTAPAAAMSSVPAIVAAQAGNATMYSFVVATVVIVLVSFCINEFSRRMAASGSLYSFVARGLGPVPALTCGAALIVGYGVLAMATLVLASTYVSALLPGTPGAPVAVAVMLALAIAAAIIMIRSVSLSSRATLVIELAAICAVVVVIAVLVIHSRAAISSPFVRPTGVSAGGFGAGVALAITAFIGFESAAALGPEARRPHRTVGRAIRRTVAGAAILYLVASWVELSEFPGGARGLAATVTPLPDLAARTAGWLPPILDLAIAASAFACATASATALTRLLFSMARERLVSRSLGRTSRRFRTPHVAVLATWVVVALVPTCLIAFGLGPNDAFVSLVTIATFGYMLAYILVCAALPWFLLQIGELTRPALAAGLVAVLVMVATFALYAWPSGRTDRLLLLLACAAVAAGTAWLATRVRRRPDDPTRIGLYDEPIASDLLGTAARRAS
ncbi:MAG: hypothetical protein QOD31_140 [Pseudonocardiales bacterium]|nr:hypothetical protein [Pseudonocardiales bacterium]